MLDITIAEYFDMWGSVLPFIMFMGGVFSLGGIIGVFIRPLYNKMISIERIQNDLDLGSAIRLWTFERWTIYLSLIVLYAIWGSLFLTPIVSYIPIVLLEMRLTSTETTFISYYMDFFGFFVVWIISFVICLIVLFFGYKIGARLLKIDKPQYYYYISNDYLVLQLRLKTNTIIPASAIKELIKDSQKRVTTVKILINWRKPTTYEFHFSDPKSFEEFIEKISGMCSSEWLEKSVTPRKMFRVYYVIKDLQLISEATMADFFHPKTLKILQRET
jgi:hypothetical protein